MPNYKIVFLLSRYFAFTKFPHGSLCLDATRPGVLSRAPRPPPRPQAAEPAHQRAGRAQAGGLWAGPGQVRAHQDLLQRGCHALVSATRYSSQCMGARQVFLVRDNDKRDNV